jgi:hypothetical protein
MVHCYILLNLLVLDKSFETLDIVPNCKSNILCYEHAEAWPKKLVLSNEINWNLSAFVDKTPTMKTTCVSSKVVRKK